MTLSSFWRARVHAQYADRERKLKEQSVEHIWLATLEAPLCTATKEQFRKSSPSIINATAVIWIAPLSKEWRLAPISNAERCERCNQLSNVERYQLVVVAAGKRLP